VYLSEYLKQALELKARSEGTTEARVIRQALEEATRGFADSAPMPRLPDWNGDGTLSGRVDELLAEGFGRA